MVKNVIIAKTKVLKQGSIEDIVNVPIMRNGAVVGVVTECVENGEFYDLTISLWQDISFSLSDNKVVSMSIS